MEIGISSDLILPEMLGTFQLWRATGHFLRMSMYFHITADILSPLIRLVTFGAFFNT